MPDYPEVEVTSEDELAILNGNSLATASVRSEKWSDEQCAYIIYLVESVPVKLYHRRHLDDHGNTQEGRLLKKSMWDKILHLYKKEFPRSRHTLDSLKNKLKSLKRTVAKELDKTEYEKKFKALKQYSARTGVPPNPDLEMTAADEPDPDRPGLVQILQPSQSNYDYERNDLICDQSALEHQDSDVLASDECAVKIFNGIEQRPIFSTIMEPVHVQIQNVEDTEYESQESQLSPDFENEENLDPMSSLGSLRHLMRSSAPKRKTKPKPKQKEKPTRITKPSFVKKTPKKSIMSAVKEFAANDVELLNTPVSSLFPRRPLSELGLGTRPFGGRPSSAATQMSDSGDLSELSLGTRPFGGRPSSAATQMSDSGDLSELSLGRRPLGGNPSSAWTRMSNFNGEGGQTTNVKASSTVTSLSLSTPTATKLSDFSKQKPSSTATSLSDFSGQTASSRSTGASPATSQPQEISDLHENYLRNLSLQREHHLEMQLKRAKLKVQREKLRLQQLLRHEIEHRMKASGLNLPPTADVDVAMAEVDVATVDNVSTVDDFVTGDFDEATVHVDESTVHVDESTVHVDETVEATVEKVREEGDEAMVDKCPFDV